MASSQSGITVLHSQSVCSYDIAWIGTSPVGTITVQLSNTYKLNGDGTVASAGSWNTIPFQDSSGSIVTSISVSGDTGSAFIDIRVTGAEAIKIIYTVGSGTGTLTAVIAGKVT